MESIKLSIYCTFSAKSQQPKSHQTPPIHRIFLLFISIEVHLQTEFNDRCFRARCFLTNLVKFLVELPIQFATEWYGISFLSCHSFIPRFLYFDIFRTGLVSGIVICAKQIKHISVHILVQSSFLMTLYIIFR